MRAGYKIAKLPGMMIMADDIKEALQTLRSGGVILYPTDTVWGIGCDATNEDAVDRIYRLKNRQDSKAMIVLLDLETRLNQYIKEVPEIAWQLLETVDTPTTIIYPGARNIAVNLIAEDGSIGIRIAKDEFCQKLISQFKKPIVSTSANISGERSPAIFDEISEFICNGVDYIVEWRRHDQSRTKPSSILKLGLGGEIQIIRT
jgi:L-threonylcarbamoyladenylate synthase